MRKIFAVLFLLAVSASNAFAWGQEGHRIVCRIAYDLLTPAEQKKVDALTKVYKTPPDTKLEIGGFPDACVFADEARSNAVKAEEAKKKGEITDSPWLRFGVFNNQHFLNVSRNTTKIAESACHDDCVLTGIATQAKALKSGATEQDRAEGLIFLGHFVGDIHQPLHISYQEDQGGNKVRPVTGGFYPVPPTPKDAKEPSQLNLHAVWDGSILRKAIGQPGWEAFADGLRKKITKEQRAKWVTTKPLQWAQESYDITTSPDVQYCEKKDGECDPFGTGRTLTSAYQKEFIGPVDLRLEEAGVRLAAMIHEALKK